LIHLFLSEHLQNFVVMFHDLIAGHPSANGFSSPPGLHHWINVYSFKGSNSAAGFRNLCFSERQGDRGSCGSVASENLKVDNRVIVAAISVFVRPTHCGAFFPSVTASQSLSQNMGDLK
jgi:hypothetical protein